VSIVNRNYYNYLSAYGRVRAFGPYGRVRASARTEVVRNRSDFFRSLYSIGGEVPVERVGTYYERNQNVGILV